MSARTGEAPFPLDGGRAGDGGAGSRTDRFAWEAHAPAAVARARRMRKEMTLGEKVLWRELRKLGLHTRRQAPLGRYIADFAIHSARLVIEVDGPHHNELEQALDDIERDAWMVSQGYRVVRFKTAEVLADPGRLARSIEALVPAPPSPTLPPSRGKGGAP